MTSVLISTAVLALILLGIQLRFFLRTSKEIEPNISSFKKKNKAFFN